MSGLVSARTAEEWEGIADRLMEEAERLTVEAKAKRRTALDCRGEAARERAERRRRCAHSRTHRAERSFSDDSYSEYAATVTVCDDCGEWWR